MKRPLPEDDDSFMICLFLAVFLTFCVSALYAME